ncbi:asparaginase domain-containing protein [Oceanithermus profundus]|uniref:Asparaginase n=1 Tax=Oceanithermus profundus (strain DSM 14977 / NBRC 100410 / VKM B-2274 / 506) TaxID=670487 RepID=E4U5J6_OCEP5|nr:asparaginase domain-containing protein [Oceanithermus profundus]ADR35499.1 asparaginase [Oceanithermus profundus DSM 14977]
MNPTPEPEFVQVFTTGGTIDKVYYDAKDDYTVGDPQIGKLLEEARVNFPYAIEALFKKDSLQMTDADRARIREAVAAAPARRVLITHGTDTMVETARALVGVPDKTIVLVGAMQPARFLGSDAEFNIGYAVAAVQLLPPGVYIAMNGQVFGAERVRKNRERLRFEAAP